MCPTILQCKRYNAESGALTVTEATHGQTREAQSQHDDGRRLGDDIVVYDLAGQAGMLDRARHPEDLTGHANRYPFGIVIRDQVVDVVVKVGMPLG